MKFSVVESSRGQNKPSTPGKKRSLPCMSPRLCARQRSGASSPSFDLHSDPEKKVAFSLFFQMRPVRPVGCQLRDHGTARAEMGNEAPSPCRPACLGLCCVLRPTSKDLGGLESECLVVPVYINALKIAPVTHSFGPLLSATSWGAFLVFPSRFMS